VARRKYNPTEIIDGTQSPTKTPAGWLAFIPTPNQSAIEKRNERNAAGRINQSAFENIMLCLGWGRRPVLTGRPDVEF
jgi:hypothetical protein